MKVYGVRGWDYESSWVENNLFADKEKAETLAKQLEQSSEDDYETRYRIITFEL